MTSVTDEIKQELMEHKNSHWKGLALSATVGIALLGGCSSIHMYMVQQQNKRIEANSKTTTANSAQLSGMSSDIVWIREALGRIEMRQTPTAPARTPTP